MKAIMISCFSFYEKRLIYINEYLQKKGCLTKILLSDFNHRKKEKDTHLMGIDSVQYINVKEYDKNLSITRLISHSNFSKMVTKYVEEEKPDLVYALIPPNLLVKKLAKLKKKLGFKLIFDVIDLWPESLPLPKADVPPFLNWKNLRNKYINEADSIVLECSLYKDKLNKIVPDEKINVFYLVKKQLEYIPRCECQPYDGKIKLAYLGSINNLIDIDMICKVVKIIEIISPVEVHIIGNGEKTNLFIDSLKKAGAYVIYYGLIYEDEKKANIFRDCHFGLNIYKPNIVVGLTMKSIDYLQFGLPLLNSIVGDTFEMIEQYGIGINIFSEDSIILEKTKTIINNMDSVKRTVENVFLNKFSELNVEKNLSFLDKVI